MLSTVSKSKFWDTDLDPHALLAPATRPDLLRLAPPRTVSALCLIQTLLQDALKIGACESRERAIHWPEAIALIAWSE